MIDNQKVARLKKRIRKKIPEIRKKLPEIRQKIKRTSKQSLPFAFAGFELILAPIIFLVIIFGKEKLALILFIITIVIDNIDRFVMLRYTHIPVAKTLIDSLVYKLLVNFAFAGLAVSGQIPMFVFIIFLSRDILYMAYSMFVIYRYEVFPGTNMPNRLALFFQIITIVAALLNNADSFLIWTSIGLSVVSLFYSIFKSEFISKDKIVFQGYSITRFIKLADFVTLLNAVSGFGAILFSLQQRYSLAMAMLLAAVVFDYLDGKVARVYGSSNEFGKELDSLSDTISFGVAPAVFGFTQIRTTLALMAFSFFVFAGMLRLARFNVMDVKGAYAGLPITASGLLIPFIYFAGVPAMFYPYIYLILAALMVSSLKIKKVI